MKKFTMLFVFMLLATAGFSQTMSTIQKGAPLNSNTGAITGYANPATSTIAITDAAQKISALPAGTVAIIITAKGGAINYGSSTVTTSTDGIWPTIAANGYLRIPIYPGETTPDIYVVNNATGTASVVARVIAEVQK